MARIKELFDVRLPLLDPIDLRGIGVPDLEKGVCRWLPPQFIPSKPNSVLFLDEISAAPPAVQAAAYQLTLDRKIGEVELPPDCRVIAAGNRVTDQAVAFKMPSPLANRFVHFEIQIDISSWRSWAFRSGIDPRVISFLTLHPEMLHKMDEGKAGQAWPSPRSWSYASEALQASLPENLMGKAVAACVGVAATRDFIRHDQDYMKIERKIVPILSGQREMTQKENDISKCQVLAVALAANSSDDAQQLDNCIRWGLCQNPEWTALLVRGLEQRYGADALQDSPAYQEYLTPGSVPNPTNAPRPRTGTGAGATPPAGF